MSKCPTCGKTVYFAERVTALGRDYHKLCFKCTTCRKQLEPGKFNERDHRLYCPKCYGSQFGERGYGYGGSGGTLSSYLPGTATSTLDTRPVYEPQQPQQQQQRPAPAPRPSPAAAPAPASGGGGPNFCPECGTRTAGARFCSNCGTRL